MSSIPSESGTTMSASEFKARCLALLDQVSLTGQPIVVTKRGRPVAKLVPVDSQTSLDLQGSVEYEREEDLVSPVDLIWEAER